ncbi:NADH dehydrogenase 1 alpha subcomplex 2 variant 1 [Chrysochromulina tobinii]|uniref:NADH dehydrogenase 1 alpha subcomplex 2 variant 1 n=1 Tax=Chrysochromulina tobinii TaxID=1460289 RepID=A0A0M0JWG7_9EUKA|nr:NADH dehydrogenase 1 alpha subcomplex 2 variant 1 [Chrysochromulina tobinii]|eukprot:KOO30900.1 NADH dehydrogenase 1 alpha subcomplex 2 variant 1 [Chrysochromulina sp. CCMP291]
MAASKALMELRVVMCQNSTGSAGVREFFAKNYAALKAANAKLPILLREGQGATAKVTAVYEFGVEKSFDVEGLPAAEVGSKISAAMKA